MPVLDAWIVDSGLTQQVSQGYNPTITVEFVPTNEEPLKLNALLADLDVVSNLPVSQTPRQLDGSIGVTWFNQYYNRIHIVPSKIELGNIVSEQYQTVEVWNANFYDVVLNSIAQSGTDEISISGSSPPSTWTKLSYKTYNLTISTSGSPDVNATYQFNWSDATSGYLKITGSRIVGFEFPFEAPATEILEWKTQVLTSNNGTEQRIRLRKAPRQTFSVRYPLQHNDLRKAQNKAYGWATRRWAVPLWSEAQKLSGNISSGVTTFNVDTTKSDYRNIGLIYLYESNDKNLTVDTSSITTTAVNLKKPLSSAFTAPWVMPVRIATARGSLRRISNGFDGAIEVDYDIIDNIDLGAGTAPTQYLGYDIYTDEVLVGEELTDTYIARVDRVDYDSGVFSTYAPWTYVRPKRDFFYLVQGMSDIWTFRKWLHRRAGRMRPFWIPSFEDDLQLTSTEPTVSDVIKVKSDYYRDFGKDRKHLAIMFKTKTWSFVEVSSTSDIGGGITQLSITPSLSAVDPKTIEKICFLGLKRLDSDRVELRWDTNRTLTCTLPILEIKP